MGGGGGFNKAVAGMNAEQAAAYFAAQKAAEAKAAEDAQAALPPSWIKKPIVLKNREDAELQARLDEMHVLVDRVHRLVDLTMEDLGALREEVVIDLDPKRLKKLQEEIEKGHRTIEQYRTQLHEAEIHLKKLHARPVNEQKTSELKLEPKEILVEEVKQ